MEKTKMQELLHALETIHSYCDKCTYCELNIDNKRGSGCGYEMRRKAIEHLKKKLEQENGKD